MVCVLTQEHVAGRDPHVVEEDLCVVMNVAKDSEGSLDCKMKNLEALETAMTRKLLAVERKEAPV